MSDAGVDRALRDLLLTNKVGSGMSRDVYTTTLLPDCVVKVEDTHGKFQNALEWEIWKRAKKLGVHHWLAPCVFISGDGMVLVQKKTRRPLPSELPKKMPAWMGDFKLGNYGVLERKGKKPRFVCHDYGYGWSSLKHGLASKKMVRCDWSTHTGAST